MKRIIIIVLSLFLSGFSAPAGNLMVSSEKTKNINELSKKINIGVFYEEPSKRVIECFDVNDSEQILIGSDLGEEKIICVYTKEGIFQYGLRMEFNGSFGLKWNDGDIQVYVVRGSQLITIHSDGRIQDIIDIEERNDEFKKLFIKKEIIVKNQKYILKNKTWILDVLSSGYSQLLRVDSQGEYVLYDVTSSQLTKSITMFVIILCFVIIAIRILIKVIRIELADKS